MAVFGAAMAILMATSSLTEIYFNAENQAQYLAESGGRLHSSGYIYFTNGTTYNLYGATGQILHYH